MPYDQKYGQNQNCIRCTNKEIRHRFIENSLCSEIVSQKDQLPLRCVGVWAKEKITRLEKYFQIFTNGMKNKWDHLNYIEICSGPGICIDRRSQLEFDGTALTILKNQAYENISKCIFIDFEEKVVDTLNKRIQKLGKKKAEAFIGDYNNPTQIIELIKRNTNQYKALNLVFIDPTDCSVPFFTIAEIKKNIQNVDFIFNIATKTDFNRNVGNIINDPNKYQLLKVKYQKFLNNNDFFDEKIIKLVNEENLEKVRKLFRNSFVNELVKIGLEHTDFKRVKNYYDILFATAHLKGKEFWEKAMKIEPDGQYQLDL